MTIIKTHHANPPRHTHRFTATASFPSQINLSTERQPKIHYHLRQQRRKDYRFVLTSSKV